MNRDSTTLEETSETHRALVFDHLRDGVVITSPEGMITDWNAGAKRMFGWSRQEMLGRPLSMLEALDLADLPGIETNFPANEKPFLRKDCSVVYCEVASVPLHDLSGKVLAQLTVYHDVTSRREMERKLIEERTLLRTIVDAVPDPIFFKDREGRYLMHNRADQLLFTQDGSDFIGKTGFEQPGLRATAEIYRTGDLHVITSGEALINVEEPFVRPDGSKGWFLTSKFPLRDQKGEIIGVVGIARDITLRKETERKLADERKLLRTVLDAIADPIFLKDRNGCFVLVNTACRTLHKLEGEVAGKLDRDFPTLVEMSERYRADDLAVLRTGTPIINREEPYLRQDGTYGWFLTSKFPLHNAAGEIIGLAGICREISELKTASEELERTQRRLIDHVENSPLAIIEWSSEMKIERWSGQAETIFGWTSDEVVGKHFSQWRFVFPDDEQQVAETIARLLDGRDSRNVCHNRNLHKNGRVVHCVWHNSVLRDADGNIASLLSLVEDVTERVLAEQAARAAAEERAAIERKLQEAQKLESLGVLAGGIAHDFNNLLSGILGHANLAASKLESDSPLKNCLEQIETAATRAAELCKQMLAYSGKGRFIVRALDLNEVVRDTIELLRISISKNVSLQFDLAPHLPPVLADTTQMRQIVMNLVINASEATGDHGGYIEVRTRNMRIDRAWLEGAHLTPDLPEGEYVCLEISDDGCGMSTEVMQKIFDPFFTTKFAGRGLGLAAVLGIVRSHNGALKVESAPGCGTVFRILLPIAEGPVESTKTPASAAQFRGSGVALVVDDEELLRNIASEMLSSLGFTVVTAIDGEDGVEKFIVHASDISVVLLDLTMPRMDGVEALREMLLIRPDARVVLMSGYSEQEAVARFTGKSLAGFLQKPFRLSDLTDKLQQALA